MKFWPKECWQTRTEGAVWYPQGCRAKETKLTFTSSCLDNQEAFYRLMLKFNKEAKLLESAWSSKKSKAKFHGVVQEQYNIIAGVSEQNLYENGQLCEPKDTFWCHLSTAASGTWGMLQWSLIGSSAVINDHIFSTCSFCSLENKELLQNLFSNTKEQETV